MTDSEGVPVKIVTIAQVTGYDDLILELWDDGGVSLDQGDDCVVIAGADLASVLHELQKMHDDALQQRLGRKS